MQDSKPPGTTSRTTKTGRKPLSAREREVLAFLADGLSGAAIAEHLVLSPETVRTHVRNAMEKLEASTRSQAVALALEHGLLEDRKPAHPEAGSPGSEAARPPEQGDANADAGPMLTALLAGVVSLADVDSSAIYTAEEGGMNLRLTAHAASGLRQNDRPQPELTLGDPGIGRVALERRARLISGSKSGAAPLIAAPMNAGGRMTGVLALGVRPSRPTSRRELLLIEAFANRVAEILAGGLDAGALRLALQRFKASWTETLDL
jgi:DNA-binding CsgD family transcriptional regulator